MAAAPQPRINKGDPAAISGDGSPLLFILQGYYAVTQTYLHEFGAGLSDKSPQHSLGNKKTKFNTRLLDLQVVILPKLQVRMTIYINGFS